MATKIIMYTGNSCSKCKRAKEMLNNLPLGHEVELIERNVDEDEYQKTFLMHELESNTLPTFVLNDESEKMKVLRGFDENIGKIMEVLGL
ncbi:NrdH-redoxin [Bacillus pseudomycoides]|uniref:glutaredoxin family protein n=1 Tax=Bacillus pseudomycoides TaxID=64104 RepID=UPI000BEF4F38|nr:glutaredoxin family protein [Bacillus pseudomycoides]PEI42562.1 NrdH-redoxin [Bacillus pseudomycoides]